MFKNQLQNVSVLWSFKGRGTALALLAIIFALCQGNAIGADGRHALIIGIGQYSEASNTTTLEGVPMDMVHARRMAREMGVPSSAIVELRDSQATKENIQKEFKKLAEKVMEGDRVFIYHSGHGTRYQQGNNCLQGLQTYTTGKFTVTDILSEAEIATYTKPISEKADKVLVMIDACFSGGVINSTTRSLRDRLNIKPKFNDNSNQQCENVGVNQITARSVLSEIKRFGVHEENFVQIAAASNNEVSWDAKELGGLATHSLMQCLTGEATDLNGSGAISLDEIRACAQIKLNALMKPHERLGMLPSTIQVRGNRNLIPVAVKPPPEIVAQIPVVQPPSQVINTEPPKPPTISPPAITAPIAELPKPPAPTQPIKPPVAIAPPQLEPLKPIVEQAEPIKPPVMQVIPPVKPVPPKPPTVNAPPPVEPALASLATLKDIEQQRNPKRVIDVKVSKPTMKIGKDSLDLSIKSSHDGYAYVVLLGSDKKSFYILYPNGLDKENKVMAGQTLQIPKADWQIKATGPAGTDNILVMVSDSPRKLDTLAMAEPTASAPFTFALNDLGGRSNLISFLTGSGVDGKSESFGAKIISVKEVQ